jgi:hypothetical protein
MVGLYPRNATLLTYNNSYSSFVPQRMTSPNLLAISFCTQTMYLRVEMTYRENQIRHSARCVGFDILNESLAPGDVRLADALHPPANGDDALH